MVAQHCGRSPKPGKKIEELIKEIEQDIDNIKSKLKNDKISEEQRKTCLEEKENLQRLLESVKIAEKADTRLHFFDVWAQ
ncbi:MAG: hypothetical protein ACTSRW_05335 [Candidatus Helarchaeota archaeon]